MDSHYITNRKLLHTQRKSQLIVLTLAFLMAVKNEVELIVRFPSTKHRSFVYVLVMIATEEEMVSAKLQLDERDYCAHKLIQYKACRADVWPFAYRCAPEKHEYLNCQYEE